MDQLSEQARRLIDDFEKKIEGIPADERNAVLRRMTSHIFSLNEEVRSAFEILQGHNGNSIGSGSKQRGDFDHLSEYL